MSKREPHLVVIGAGIGGLATALRLTGTHARITVIDPADAPGGKMRQMASSSGPIDAGPTVLTLRPVFENLFQSVGEALSDHVELEAEPLLARHFWEDGTVLDLCTDMEANIAAITEIAGPREAQAFAQFTRRAQDLFSGFDAPMMQAAEPRLSDLALHVAANPHLALKMAPLSTLAGLLRKTFRDPKLQQLFGRYATYVGGMPGKVPGLLSLIWASEFAGVWRVKGGMQRLAQAIANLAEARGAAFMQGRSVDRIELQSGRVAAVVTDDGTRLPCDAVIFNGDPRALEQGLLGNVVTKSVASTATTPRSLSAYVWHFAAEVSGLPLAHHNVFFSAEVDAEFPDLAAGQMPDDATLYVCAQDRGSNRCVSGRERFEIIMNGPPGCPAPQEEFTQCQTRTFQRLETMGLRFSPRPGRDMLTTPTDFAARFPGSEGSLYGRSPHGMMAAFQRPTARSLTPGLYLAGGGAHPGAGVPMACLSGRHAAEAITTDLALTSMFHQTVTHGGMSTGSAPTRSAPSP